MGMPPVVTSELNGIGLGYTSGSWLSPHRDAQLLTPTEDLWNTGSFFVAGGSMLIW
tara:strand:- start:749 stop:916 length:168 start_codon:yes stop_codon:yes gene_type:complete